MARTVRRGVRRDGVVRIGRASPWKWVWIAAGTLIVIGPLALSLAVVLPPIVFALPPMALWVAIWAIFRRLDAPQPPQQPPPPRGTRVVLRIQPRPVAAADRTCRSAAGGSSRAAGDRMSRDASDG